MSLIKNLSIVAIVFSCLIAFSQEDPNTIIIDNDTIVIKAFPLTEVSNHAESAYNEIKSIRDKIKTFDDQLIIDTLTRHGRKFIAEETADLKNRIGSMSKRELLDTQKDWSKVRNDLENWKERFNQRNMEIGKISQKTLLMLQVWTLTLEKAKEENAVEQLIKTIEDILNDIKQLNTEVRNKQNQFYLNQNNVLEFILKVDETLNLLDEETKATRLTYLSIDSPSIWAISDSVSSAEVFKSQGQNFLKRTSNDLKFFLKGNEDRISTQILLFVLLLISLFILNRLIAKTDNNAADVQMAKKSLSSYYLAAWIITIFTSVWFYPIIPYVISEIIKISIILVSFFFFPLLLKRKTLPFIVSGIVVLLILNEGLYILDGMGFISRILLYFEILLAGLMLVYLIRQSKIVIKVLNLKYWGLVNYLAPVLLIFLTIAFIGNTFGFVDLSILLTNATVNLILNAVILIILSFSLNSIVVGLFETKFFQKSNIISEHSGILKRRITSVITLFTIVIWLNSFIRQLGFEKPLWDWLSGLLEISWSVGTTTISLGVIISVLLVIAITYALVRAVSILLEKELFPRIQMPRGIPGAISMIIRYIIVGFGFYFVLSAAGIDLGRFGLIAGALGVGIGFGLQNVVYNFIAGLVLAFERPIQVGDVIEVGTLMGTVTSIGVRSSHVSTFDGSEVIVPNGNLISKEVTNWTLSDRKKRREIQVGVAYGSNPHQVLEILSKAASQHVNVLETPSPWATFEGFGDSSLNFKIRFWVPFDIGISVKSQVAMNIYDALEEAGIQIPFPQQDVYIKSIDKNYRDVTDQKFNTPGFDKKDNDLNTSS
ncbi:MAG: mechanosensitive ion channel [Bacteroidetes bacterium]|nr:mechanosensitive ion channel [Bacteroidota bacterium]